MDQALHNYNLIISLLKAELSVNAMVMALSKAGFRNERNIYSLHTQLLGLIGFSGEESEKDELVDFYVKALDQFTKDNLLESTENIHETALRFYSVLIAQRNM